MNTAGRRSHLVPHVLSCLLLPAFLVAGCAHNSMPEARGEPASDWPAATFRSQEAEFLCADNPYLEGQFDLRIVDDLGETSGTRECKRLPTELKDVKSVLWIVVPALVKTRRDIDYIYRTPTIISKIDVRSRPIIRVSVLAYDPRDGSCADGSFETTVSETQFRMPVESAIAGNGSDLALRHAKEASSVQLHLSDIHEGVRSALTVHKKELCVDLFRNFNFLRRLWVSTPIATIESLGYRVRSPIPEMESVVRIRTSFGDGSGFYIEDTSDGTAKPAESTLVLTNYHVVKHARHGVVRVSTLMHESVLHALEQGGAGEWFADYFPGTVIFYDERRDLALVRVSNGGPPLELYQEAPMPPGIHEVMALGHPLDNEFYATRGIVSRIIVDCKLERSKGSEGLNSTPLKCIEHDAAINPGNSGGPLLFLGNGRGTRVLGVNVGVRAERFRSVRGHEYTLPFPGLSTAIHYEEVRGFLDEFMKFRPSD